MTPIEKPKKKRCTQSNAGAVIKTNMQVEYDAKIFLLMFFAYLVLGAAIVAYATRSQSFIDAMYANFRALTADFDELAPERHEVLRYCLN